MSMLWLCSIAVFWSAWIIANTHPTHGAPASPFGWQETQPDGSPTGRLFLRGHPSDTVYTVDRHEHPVVVDDDGWYVYGSLSRHTNETNATDRGSQQRQLWHPTSHKVSPNSKPPGHLQQQVVTARTFPDTHRYHPTRDEDSSCLGQRHSLWCPQDSPLSSSLARSKQSAPRTIGTTRAIVVLVRFSDHVDREMPSRQDLDYFFNGHGTHEELAPTGTLQEFFKLQSYGQYTVVGDLQDWIVAPYTEDYYSYGKFGMTSYFAKCAYGALDKMDAKGVDWSQYDQDRDGVLDSVVIFHSGYVAEGGGTDCINGKTHGDHRIWSHATSVVDNRDAWYSSDRSVRMGMYSTTSAVRGTCGSEIQRIGIVGHEMLHMIGLPDLLGLSGTGVGIWDVMGQCWGADGSLLYPATMSPWCRHYVGWLEPTRINESGKYELETSQLYPQAYQIDVGFPQGEYLLIENRQKLFHDAVLPGEGGLLIWHIDESNATDWMAAPGWPMQEGWPGNGYHYQVALLSPDGKYHAEKGKNFGDKWDFWTNRSSLEPGPGTSLADIENEELTYPNTDSYQNGIIQRTGIRIYDISELGEIMTFRVDVPGSPIDSEGSTPFPVEPTVQPSRPPTELPTKQPTLSPLVTDDPSTSPTSWSTSFTIATSSPVAITELPTTPPLEVATERPTESFLSRPQPSSSPSLDSDSDYSNTITTTSPVYFQTTAMANDGQDSLEDTETNVAATTTSGCSFRMLLQPLVLMIINILIAS